MSMGLVSAAISGIGGIIGARTTGGMMEKYIRQAAARLGITEGEYGAMVTNFQQQAMPHNKLGATAAREATRLIEGGPEAAQARYMMHPKHQAAVESQMSGLAATGAGSRSGAGERAQAALAEVEAGAPYRLAAELSQVAGSAAQAGARYGQLGVMAQGGRATARQHQTDMLLQAGQTKARRAGATITGIGNLIGGGIDIMQEDAAKAAAATTGGASMAMSGSSPSFDSSKGWGQGPGQSGMAAQQGPGPGQSGLLLGDRPDWPRPSGYTYEGGYGQTGVDEYGNPMTLWRQ